MSNTITEPKQSRSEKKKKKKKEERGWRTAEGSDIHELYELSVQEPEAEVDLINQVWEELRNRKCVSIREDFCGTAAASMAWVKDNDENIAVGVDIDQSVLDWGRAKIADRLTDDQAKRLKLVEGDVRTADTGLVDSVCAMNFSYFLFNTRDALREYFRSAYANLKDDGLFMLDAYGGSEAFEEMEEERDLDGFTYIWDQNYYNPITGAVVNYIHFHFPDGTKIERAFTYKWRLWTLPEIQELLLEAGFSNVVVYWEGTEEDSGEGDGNWSISTRGEACEGWVAYLVAEK